MAERKPHEAAAGKTPSSVTPAHWSYLALGLTLVVLGLYLVYCYYEKSGRQRGFIMALLPA